MSRGSNRSGWLVIVCALSWMACAAVARGPARVADDSALAAAIDRAVARTVFGGFWGTVLVARGGDVLFSKGYGFADYESRPNGPDTLFEIASVSKQFTAAAILRLEQQGKLRTTDTLDGFFPEIPEDKRSVTIDHLLRHISGLSPTLGVPYDWAGGRDEYAKEMLTPPLAAPAGEKFAYSNAGYALLAAIVEVASGRSFEDYMRGEVFAAAGLRDTGFIGEARLMKSERISTRLSEDSEPQWSAADWHWGWGYRGMGGVVTTANDMLRWDRALRGPELLGAEAKIKLHAPGKGRYACGWVVESTERGTTKASHSGLVSGYGAYLSRWIEEDVVVVILSNGRTNVPGIEAAIAKLLFPAPRIVLDLDAGSYDLNAHRSLVIDDGAAWALDGDETELRMRLKHRGHELASIRVPRGMRDKLVAELDSALAQNKFPDPDAPAAMEAGMYLGFLGASERRFHLVEGLEIQFMPSYNGVGETGEPVEDPRIVAVVASAPHHGWPVMVKMNPAAARALSEALRAL